MPYRDNVIRIKKASDRYYKKRKIKYDAMAEKANTPIEIDNAFGYWFSGFCDGEACFLIGRNGKRWIKTRFILGLRADDKGILENIQSVLGMGKIYYREPPLSELKRSPNTKPQYRIEINKKADCYKLMKLFERYPLRTKKYKDFQIWSDAVRMQGIFAAHGQYDLSEMLKLCNDIKEIKQYREVTNA